MASRIDLQAFLAEVQVSPSTRRSYELQLVRYLQPWLKQRRISLQKLTWRQFLEYLEERGWGYNMSKQAQSAIRKCLAWAQVENHPLQTNSLRRQETEKGYAVTPDDIKALGRSISRGSHKDWRNYAMLLVSFHCGLRSDELISLRVQDLDFEAQRIYVHKGKGGRKEMAPFHPEAAIWVRHYLDDIRPLFAANGTDAVWVGINGHTPGHPMTTGGWRSIFRKWGQRAGVPRLSPHTLRRGFAHYYIRAGLSTAVVMKAGRWKNFSSFDRYIQDIGAGDFLEAVRSLNGKGKVGASLPAGAPGVKS